MALRTASPVWLTVLLAVGLFFVLVGERPLDDFGALRALFTGLGLLLIAASSVLRGLAFTKSKGTVRKVEKTFTILHAGSLLGLLVYFLSTETGRGLIGQGGLEGETLHRFSTSMTVLYLIILVCSLVPLIMVEFTLGSARRTKFSPSEMNNEEGQQGSSVETVRVSEIAASGLSISLALGLLMVTCGVAKERDITKDYSYFKTSEPGESTVNIVKEMDKPLKVYLFFPEREETTVEVSRYFERLKDKVGNVVIEKKSLIVDAQLVRDLKVKKERTIVLAKGEANANVERITISDREKRYRKELRELDKLVNEKLAKVRRKAKIAYLTVGHGEANTKSSDTGLGIDTIGAATAFKSALMQKGLNYQVKELGAAQGLGTAIPDDAAIVMVLAPSIPLADDELATLTQYVEGGGNLLIALDPSFPIALDPLLNKLGVQYNPVPVLDDKSRLQGPVPEAYNYVVTSSVASHPATTAIDRASARLIFLRTGHLTEAKGQNTFKNTFLIKSEKSSWADLNLNSAFDADSEKRTTHNLIAAIETRIKPKTGPTPGRAIIIADGHVITDSALGPGHRPKNALQQLWRVTLADMIKWLGGEESIVGEVKVEADIEVVHSKNENMVWFWSNVFVVPFLVLGLGLAYVYWHNKRQRRVS